MTPTTALFRYSVYFFGAYLGLSLLAFWPLYLSDPGQAQHPFVHVHAVVMAAWLTVLTAQAGLVRYRLFGTHRFVGKLSIALAPLVVVTLAMVAHEVAVRADSTTPTRLAQVAFQLSHPVVFAAFFGAAILKRHEPAVHARWMFCSVLIATSAILDRVLAFYLPSVAGLLPRFIDGSRILPLVYVILGALTLWDWRTTRKPGVFVIAMAVFALQHSFAWVAHHSDWWKAVTLWFMSLPLS